MHSNRKSRRAGAEAMGLWVMCGSYVSQIDEDGTLAPDEIQAIALTMGMKRWAVAVEKLVAVGLWERDGARYRFHHWDHYREGGEAELKRAKEANKARQKAFRDRQKAAADALGSGVVTDTSVIRNVTDNGPTRNESNALPDPTRPDPTKQPPTPGGESVTPEGIQGGPVFDGFGADVDGWDNIDAMRGIWTAALCHATGAPWPGVPSTREESAVLLAIAARARESGCAWAALPGELVERFRDWRAAVSDARFMSNRPSAYQKWHASQIAEQRRADEQESHDGGVSLRKATGRR